MGGCTRQQTLLLDEHFEGLAALPVGTFRNQATVLKQTDLAILLPEHSIPFSLALFGIPVLAGRIGHPKNLPCTNCLDSVETISTLQANWHWPFNSRGKFHLERRQLKPAMAANRPPWPR